MQKLVQITILAATPASEERLHAVSLGKTPEHNVAGPQTALKPSAARNEV